MNTSIYFKNHKAKIIVFSIFTFLWAAFIFFMSAQNGNLSGLLSSNLLKTFIVKILEILPALTQAGLSADIRKYAHIFEFFMLGTFSMALSHELWLRLKLKNPKALFSISFFAFFTSAAFCFLYASSDEWHQCFVPGRGGSFLDVIKYDFPGALLGILLVFIICIIVDNVKKTKSI